MAVFSRKFSGDPIVHSLTYANLFRLDTERRFSLGHRVALADGRVFRYCATDSDIGIGNAVVSQTAPEQIDAATSYFGADAGVTDPTSGRGGAIGDTAVEIYLGAGRAIDANEYAGGVLNTGDGYAYLIRSHPAIAASNTGLITLDEIDGIRSVIVNTLVGCLSKDMFADVAAHTSANYASTPTEFALGRASVASGAGGLGITQYLFVQTWGPCVMLADTAGLLVGGNIQLGEANAGRVQVPVTDESIVAHWGQCIETGAAGVWALVNLTVMP